MHCGEAHDFSRAAETSRRSRLQLLRVDSSGQSGRLTYAPVLQQPMFHNSIDGA